MNVASGGWRYRRIPMNSVDDDDNIIDDGDNDTIKNGDDDDVKDDPWTIRLQHTKEYRDLLQAL